MIKIFISHSSHDRKVAGALADLFSASIKFSKAEIRCTSVDGYRLPGGAVTDAQLKKEILGAPVLVGLLSHHSFESAYVLFELGARWGTGAYMIPLLAPGVSASILQHPISSLNALSCDSASQVHQLVQDVASQLGEKLEPASAYQELVEKICKFKELSNIDGQDEESKISQSHESAGLLEDEETAKEIIKSHCESEWGDDFRMINHCISKQLSSYNEIRNKQYRDIPTRIVRQIRTKARQDWPNDFQMRLYTEKKQIEAFRELNRDE